MAQLLEAARNSPIVRRFQNIVHHVTVHEQTQLTGVTTRVKSNRSSRDSILIYDSDGLQQQQLALKVEDNPEMDGMKSVGSSYKSDEEFKKLSDDELVKTCADVVNAFYSKCGEGRNVEPYLSELFQRVPSDKYSLFCGQAKAAATKETEFKLSCEVVRANDLVTKDKNSPCNPYCVMGVLHQNHHDDKMVKNNLHIWKENGLVKSSAQSAVKENTPDPVWEERFELIVESPLEEYFVIEIWNDDSLNRGKQKGIGGLTHFLKDLKKEDFIGRTFFSLQTISSANSCYTLILTSHSTHTKRGTVTLQLEMRGAKVEGMSIRQIHDEHRNLVTLVYGHESYQNDSHIKRWNGVLSDSAVSLLSHHATICCISPLKQAAVQISVLMDYHRSYAVEMSALRLQLIVVKKYDMELTRKMQAADSPESDHHWVLELLGQLKDLALYIVNIMEIHLEMFDVKYKNGIERLRSHLLTFQDLYSITSFVAQLPEDQKDYHCVLTSCIQTSVLKWFQVTTANSIRSHDVVTKTLTFKEFCNDCLNQCNIAQKIIGPVFQEIGVDYFSLFFTSFDVLFYAEASKVLVVTSDELLLLTTFNLYKIIQCFVPLAEKVSKSWLQQQQTELHTLNCHLWFKNHVPEWISIAVKIAKERILKAIEIDTVIEVTNQVPYSSSAVDAHTTFQQVILFWKELDWPDRQQSYIWFVTVIKRLCELTIFYTDSLHQKLRHHQDLTETAGEKFEITDKLCVTLNNVKHMQEVLGNIHEEMDLPVFFKWLDEGGPIVEQGCEGQLVALSLSKKTRSTFTDLISSAQEDIQHKLQEMADGFRPRLLSVIRKLFPNLKEEHFSEEAVSKMLEYMVVNLQQLSDGLLSQVFLSVVNDLWKDVINALKVQYHQISHKPSMRHCYVNLLEVTSIMRDFFHNGGKGLTADQLQTDQYLALFEMIRLGTCKTEEVIQQFLRNLVEQQKGAETECFGMINLSHSFSCSTNTLTVLLANATNIPAMKKWGSSDPFIEVTMLPGQIKHSQKSSVQKSTLDPVFNQELKINVQRHEISVQQGSVILLALFDHDNFSANKFAGLCVIQGSSVPAIEEAERKTEHLNLFHFKESQAFCELTLRSEASAVTFCKFMRRLQPRSHTVRYENAVSK